MRTVQTIVVIAGLLFSFAANAAEKPAPKATDKIEPLPRDLEIQLALSALPPHLRDRATVYVCAWVKKKVTIDSKTSTQGGVSYA